MIEDLRKFKRIQVRRGLAERLSETNPLLKSGEICFETDTNKFKIGDGIARWENLVYFTDSTSGGGGSGDYTPDDLDNWDETPETITEALDLLSKGLTITTYLLDKIDTGIGNKTYYLNDDYPNSGFYYGITTGVEITFPTPTRALWKHPVAIISSNTNTGNIIVHGVGDDDLTIEPGYFVQFTCELTTDYNENDEAILRWIVVVGWPITTDFTSP